MQRYPTALRTWVRRPALRGAALAVLALAGLGCPGSPPPPAESSSSLGGAAAGRSVLLLTIDTLRADRLGAYGYAARPNSPRIDALLDGGIRFDAAMAPRSITWPSLATVLTGLYPSGHGVIENGYSLPDDLDTLPKAFGRSGYQTGAFLSNMCKANHQGWDAFRCTGGQDGKAVKAALEWLAGRDRERPFFLWVHLFGPHPPYYNGGDRAIRELDPGYDGPLGTKKWQLERVMRESIDLAPRDVEHLDAIYDAAVMGTDGIVGRLLDGMAADVAPESLLTVFLADHGEELYEHNGYIFHACSVYQTTLHVPMAVVAPGLLPAGGAVPQTVELSDAAPTLLDLMGIEGLPEKQGVSLRRYLARPGEPGAEKPAFSEYGDTRLHTVLAGGWKLVDNPDGLSPVCLAEAEPGHYPIAEVELYDLRTDPGEQNDVAAEHPAKVAELRELIERRFAGLAGRAGDQEIPEELKRELEALGYVAN